jgi:hypothetical protein
MTRTTDEIIKPLPGQMAFGFMHAESGPAERLEPEPPGPARRGQESGEGPAAQTAGVRPGR